VKPAHDLDRARPCPLRNISLQAPVSHNEHAYTAKSERFESDPLYTDFGRQVWTNVNVNDRERDQPTTVTTRRYDLSRVLVETKSLTRRRNPVQH